jgi:hypothetical protein
MQFGKRGVGWDNGILSAAYGPMGILRPLDAVIARPSFGKPEKNEISVGSVETSPYVLLCEIIHR